MNTPNSNCFLSQVAQPPVIAPPFEISHPLTKRVENNQCQQPDKIDTSESDAVILRKEKGKREKGICGVTLPDAQANGEQMKQDKMRHVKSEGHSAEHDQCVFQPSTHAVCETTQDRHWPERGHQQ